MPVQSATKDSDTMQDLIAKAVTLLETLQCMQRSPAQAQPVN